jgi:Tfp pilus assembly protein PilF
LEGEGKKEEARQVLEKVIEQRPNRAEAKMLLACMIMGSDGEQARELLDEVNAKVDQITDNILVSRMYTAYGLLAEKAGETEKAIDYHKKALDLFKYNPESTAALARLIINWGQVPNCRQLIIRYLSPKNSNLIQSAVAGGFVGVTLDVETHKLCDLA